MVLVVCGTCAIYEPLWLGSSRDHRKGAEGVSFNSYLFPRSWLNEKKTGFFSDGSVTSQSVAIISIRGLLVDLNHLWLGSSRDHRKGAEGVSFNSYLFPRSWLNEKKTGFFSDGSVTSQSVAIISIRGLLVDLNQILQSYIIKIM